MKCSVSFYHPGHRHHVCVEDVFAETACDAVALAWRELSTRLAVDTGWEFCWVVAERRPGEDEACHQAGCPCRHRRVCHDHACARHFVTYESYSVRGECGESPRVVHGLPLEATPEEEARCT